MGSTICGVAGTARRAAAAGGEAEQDPVADPGPLHPVSDCFHHPGAFVTEDSWQREGNDARGGAHVGVAHPHGHHPDANLVAAKCVEVNLLHLERVTGSPHHCRRGSGHDLTCWASAASRGNSPTELSRSTAALS